MSVTDIPTTSGSQLMPVFSEARVSDAMRHGVITCPPETPLVTVARMMAAHHVHAVVVTPPEAEHDAGDEVAWGVVSDRELLGAAAHAEDMTAGGTATIHFASVTPDDSLVEAGKRMLAHGTAHAVVIGQSSSRPIGMLSSLDIAGVLAWGRG